MSGFVVGPVFFTANRSKAAVCRFRVTKSAVFLRRFCFARKLEQGNAIPLSVVFFLSDDYYRCSNDCTAADKQQCDPQHKIAVVAGRGSLRQLRRYGVGFLDFLCTVLVAEILITAFAVPILDIALGGLGRRLCVDMLEVGVVVCVKLSVFRTADLTLCLALAPR